ncbi:hypothetical protein FC093_16795 [Ilyomonas limi]|uniref:RNA polymerase sigma factor 70 region 4 type 2 domain-containing protein n=1 Tax=Ilyomonas limi TaxID=2575867 RepID=A0A4U3KWD9_9BACT|nr:hypothetical protein [Ilyomonas limi]TKK66692.1 hypothetical protein FC093_16795 [Ilyomonas limi]
MEPLSNTIQLFSLPGLAPKAYNNHVTETAAGIKEYEPLLYKIASSFGFIDNETMDLVQQVCSCFNVYCTNPQNGTSLKIRLSKFMVHQCIFKISSQLFSQNVDAEKLSATDMPLSFRSVFILHHIIGFDEYEIAEILNTNLLQVKHRLSKALLFINNQY